MCVWVSEKREIDRMIKDFFSYLFRGLMRRLTRWSIGWLQGNEMCVFGCQRNRHHDQRVSFLPVPWVAVTVDRMVVMLATGK